jgi:cytochrome c oxidase subunit 2
VEAGRCFQPLIPTTVPIPSALITLILGMGLVLAGLWIGENVQLLPLDASTNAPIYDSLFRVLFSIGSILFLGVVGLLVFSLVKFRRRTRRARRRRSHRRQPAP